jgi:hypothetical protein
VLIGAHRYEAPTLGELESLHAIQLGETAFSQCHVPADAPTPAPARSVLRDTTTLSRRDLPQMTSGEQRVSSSASLAVGKHAHHDFAKPTLY